MSEPLTRHMDNLHSYNLGIIAVNAGAPSRKDVGDLIDRGLILRRLLEDAGYSVIVATKTGK